MLRFKQIIVVLTAVCAPGLFTAFARNADRPEPALYLVSPAHHAKIFVGNVTFRWSLQQPEDTVLFVPEYYEVQFWSEHRTFSVAHTVFHQGDSPVQSLIIYDFRDIFRKHGVYKWRVRAVSETGQTHLSEANDLVIPVPHHMQSGQPAYLPYAVQIEQTTITNRYALSDFFSQVYPGTHFENHAEISLVFRQPMLMNSLIDLQERLIFSSLIGVGAEIEARLLLYENVYIGIYPQCRAGILTYGNSLEHYASQRYHVTLGARCVINPRGHVVWSLSWTPAYRVRYMVHKGGLRTLEGSGWELSCRLHVPRHVCAPFNVAGIPVDLQRMPVEISQLRIHDAYADRHIRSVKIGIRYLFK